MEPMTPESAALTGGYEMPDTYGATVRTHEPVDQRLAVYRPAEEIAASCALCVHYHADDCACHRVAGHIRPDYVCDLFDAATLAERATEAAVLDGAYLVAKADDEQQIIFGWANVAVTKTGEQTVDHHADMIDPAELEAAAYDFVLNARASGEDHLGDVDAVCVESIVFTKEKAAALGIPDGVLPEAGWWVGFHIPDRDAYLRARTQKQMFSIEGTAVREPVEIAKAAIAPHKTATSGAPWDGPANETRVKGGQPAAYYAKVYAWRDPEADPTVKTPYRFIHHEVSADGTPGAANVKALQTAIGVLNGGRGVSVAGQPWADDRSAIYAHLAAHLRDAGLTPPPLS